MAWIVAFISQKVALAKVQKPEHWHEKQLRGHKTKLADLDTEQATSADWHRRRLAAGYEPAASVEVFYSSSGFSSS